MRPPSKHGLERKFKPWRKGKSLEKKKAGGGPPQTNNASLKNQLRGQKRLLAKLQKDNNGDEDALTACRERIADLERGIMEYKAREFEKKNAAKYHQVKFIERQKLTRLEKSVKRQLHQLQNQQQSSNKNEISQLQEQLQSIAMDQLYIAFYPTNMKYMALFTNGTERIQDDERGSKRRREVWSRIRQELLAEKKRAGGSDDDGGGNDKKMMQLNNAKKWANLDLAKKALLSMPEGTYPNNNDISASTVGNTNHLGKNKQKKESKIEKATEKKKSATDDDKGKGDSRFALSKQLDGMFHESTTGEDYHKEITITKKEPKKKVDESRRDGSSSSSSSDSSDDSDDSSSEDDDADPLKGFDGKKKNVASTTTSKPKVAAGSSSSSSSSSAPSSDSSDSDSSDSSDSDSDDEPSSSTKHHTPTVPDNDQDEGGKDEEDDEGEDDFFSSNNKISTEDVFTQVQKANEERKKNRARGNYNHHDDDGDAHFGQHKKKPDKSKGFKSQTQSRREYRAYQNRQKRQKFG